MVDLFITIRFLDLLDILLVAFLIYNLYLLVKGTAAFNIILGIFIFYITWIIIKGLKMELVSSIIGQVIGVGVLALIVVFQPEIRKLFLILGTKYNLNSKLSFDRLFSKEKESFDNISIKNIGSACKKMSETKTGALIVVTYQAELKEYVETGEIINSTVSDALLETIFFKNSPLHDGAVIIDGNKVLAARCVLPVSNNKLKNQQLGMRHRAAITMSNVTDAIVIVVSEETGKISMAINGILDENLSAIELMHRLENVNKE